MPGFAKTQPPQAGFSVWRPDPDDAAAHRVLLQWLSNAVGSVFLAEGESFTNAIKGNLGEFIAYQVGKNYAFVNGEIAHSANATEPLSRISRSRLDVVWMYFGDNASDDWAAIQEVKTTGQASLDLADDLINDYKKLFGDDHRVRLQSRLTGLMNVLDELGRGDLSPRLAALGGLGPDSAAGIKLYPTLLHESGIESSTKMLAIRQAIMAQGWSSHAIDCWSIGLAQIDHQLERLARGQL